MSLSVKRPRPSGDQHWTRRKPEKIRRGSDAPGAKLSPGEIASIRAEAGRGASQTWLAKKYNVSRITIWRHLKAREM